MLMDIVTKDVIMLNVDGMEMIVAAIHQDMQQEY